MVTLLAGGAITYAIGNTRPHNFTYKGTVTAEETITGGVGRGYAIAKNNPKGLLHKAIDSAVRIGPQMKLYKLNINEECFDEKVWFEKKRVCDTGDESFFYQTNNDVADVGNTWNAKAPEIGRKSKTFQIRGIRTDDGEIREVYKNGNIHFQK